jgi:hypothetical protein
MLYWPDQKIAIAFQTNSDFAQIGPQTIDIRDRLMKALLIKLGSSKAIIANPKSTAAPLLLRPVLVNGGLEFACRR